MDDSRYQHVLHLLQIELVKLQKSIIKHDEKILIIFEGRDAGGKEN
jgi:polyphosphate kinase 2 (PPK2 family)